MKLRPIVLDEKTIGYAFWCPGCKEAHTFYVQPRHPGGPVWMFNGNMDEPTFSPSLKYMGERLCHLFVVAGKIQYLADSWHEYRSQTIPLADWPY